ncbi:MAG: alkaline phosphatase family protein [Bacteroidales bacterium]|nr:alkaline phosphatase family protein [Bacteroidales bacterium]
MNNTVPLFKLRLFIISLLILIFSSCNPKSKTPDRYVVMLSMDGFRWDYTDKFPTPNFDKIEATGVKAISLQPSYPTKTFPNHYTMATGLYPDHNGIVMNNFYAPELDAFYSIKDRKTVENPAFYKGEPIWVTAEKQGITSASCFWVGSEAAIMGISPKYWKKYEHNLPFAQRIDTVLYWLRLATKERPRLITWYMHEPDSKGHRLGPNNPELGKTIVLLDSLLGVFMKKIKELPNSEEINIIVTSDHGMCETSSTRWINLSDYLNKEWFEIIEGGNPNYNFFAKTDNYQIIKDALQKIPNVHAWAKSEVPKRLHYGTSPRTGDFILVADSGYVVAWEEAPPPFTGGAHGYDNRNTDMHAIFYAYGPAFKVGFVQPTFNNTDIYPLICEILHLKPAEVDGKLENVKGMLKPGNKAEGKR